MYLQATIGIDPSQITKISVRKPTKAFGKMLHLMTAGVASGKEEQETFTAVAILQSLNAVFRAAGIDNVVRLAKDDESYYLDTEGRRDDLREAMNQFKSSGSGTTHRVFETLKLVLEDRDDELRYLIEVDIERVHRVGVYPIRIVVNGFFQEFAAGVDVDRETMLERLQEHFGSQDGYDEFVWRKKGHFNDYLDRLVRLIHDNMGADDVKIESGARIIRPKKRARERPVPDLGEEYDDPFFYGYYGYDDFFLYAWLWSEMCHDHAIHCSDCCLTDEHGRVFCEIGGAGIDAGSGGAFDPDAAFEVPGEGATFFAGSDYSDELSGAGVALAGDFGAAKADIGGADGGGFLSGIGETVSGWADSVSDAVSSCGGGDSSCGGGCGGD